MVDKERIEELLQEATVDCYGEEEEFTGILYTLDERLGFPLRARVLGVQVQVVGLDDGRSSPRRGIVARVKRAGQEYRISLADLEFIDPDPQSAEWLAMYQQWLQW